MQGRRNTGGKGKGRDRHPYGERRPGGSGPAPDKASIQALTAELAEPIVAELGLELVDVEFIKEAGQWVLRVFVDKPGGVTIEDCEAVSEPLGRKLDRVDPIPFGYTFEVSSPGAERPLKTDADFARFAGRRVRVSLYAPAEDGRKVVEGVLVGLRDGLVVIDEGDKETALPKSGVARARLALDTIGGYGK